MGKCLARWYVITPCSGWYWCRHCWRIWRLQGLLLLLLQLLLLQLLQLLQLQLLLLRRATSDSSGRALVPSAT